MRQLSLILVLVCAACSASPPADPPAPPSVGAPVSIAQIQALVGTAACTASRQCKTLPIGERACGGPERYLAYSTAATPSAALEGLAERYRQQRRTAIAQTGEVSSCQFLIDPGAICRAGACQLNGADPF